MRQASVCTNLQMHKAFKFDIKFIPGARDDSGAHEKSER